MSFLSVVIATAKILSFAIYYIHFIVYEVSFVIIALFKSLIENSLSLPPSLPAII